jgi:hypothetical protein
MNRYRIYTGPTIVKQVAEKLRALNIDVFLEGTEHVYVSTSLAIHELLKMLPTWRGADFRALMPVV